jgi:AraC-like DNA-binding protein
MKNMLKIRDWFHADGFPISVQRREPQKPFGRHSHEFAEIVIVRSGKGMHRTEQDTWELARGDAFVISGKTQHEYLNVKDLRLINILYQPDRIDMRLHDLNSIAGYHALFKLEPAQKKRRSPGNTRMRLEGRDLAKACTMVEQLESELDDRKPGFGFMATALFMSIIGFLSRCYGNSPAIDDRALLRIGEAMSRLESKFEEDLNLDNLAEIAHMSKRSFMRAFHSATGTSPHAWMISQRIQRASLLLRQSETRITEVAYDCGFRDSNYFSRQFKKFTGLSPRAYRAANSLRH